MATYNKYDPRIDSMVVENHTDWAPEVTGLTDADRQWIATSIHESAALASQINYERAHTGFTRIITVTSADIERLYANRSGPKN